MTRNSSNLSLALLAVIAYLLSGVNLLAWSSPSGGQSQTDSSASKKTTQQKRDASAKDAATSSSPPSNGSCAPSSGNSPSSASASGTTTCAAAAKSQTAPANSAGMVWVNTDTGVYHKQGSRWYGKTKKGKYMLEADALKAGYKPAKKSALVTELIAGAN